MSTKDNSRDEWLDVDIAPVGKTAVSIRLDDDIIKHFKSQGRGYQTRINTVLRAYMSAHKKP